METRSIESILRFVLRNYVFNTKSHEPPDFKDKELFARAVSRELGISRESVTKLVDDAFR
jgi:hypothetical protein